MPTKVIVDCSTGETTEVELTAEEIADMEAAQKAAEAERKAQEVIAKAKAKAKSDLLDRLGLTAEEAALLIS
jgi:regulator of protease activity HflC (stomatin/prohibitin superfamily)